jgi:hypothetical protein
VLVERRVGASGLLVKDPRAAQLRSEQFWFGPDRAGTTVAFWADTTVVHLLINGVRLKTVPSRLTVAHLQRLLDEDARPAGPPPIATGQYGAAIEVDRTVNACGLARRQHPIGYQYAGRRLTVRLDAGLLQLVDDGVLLPSLPNPLTRPSRPGSVTPAPPDRPSTLRVPIMSSALVAAGFGHRGEILCRATVQRASGSLTVTGR